MARACLHTCVSAPFNKTTFIKSHVVKLMLEETNAYGFSNSERCTSKGPIIKARAGNIGQW
jgi:hypothetical protein